MKLIDISLPIHNNMWSYKPQWQNNVELFESTMNGDMSTVYKLTVYSHTGTYIETSSHKLKSELLLNELPIESFYRKVKVVILSEEQLITKNKETILSPLPETGLGLLRASVSKSSEIFSEEVTRTSWSSLNAYILKYLTTPSFCPIKRIFLSWSNAWFLDMKFKYFETGVILESSILFTKELLILSRSSRLVFFVFTFWVFNLSISTFKSLKSLIVFLPV